MSNEVVETKEATLKPETQEIVDDFLDTAQKNIEAFYNKANEGKTKLLDIINNISNENYRGLNIENDFIGIMFVNKEGKLCNITWSITDENMLADLIEESKSKQ